MSSGNGKNEPSHGTSLILHLPLDVPLVDVAGLRLGLVVLVYIDAVRPHGISV